MALEQIDDRYWQFEPGPIDVHSHPRVFDALTTDGFVSINGGTEGKAGLRAYTETALRAGIVSIIAMPNESVRLYDESNPEKTEEIAFPIASLDRVRAMQAAISHESAIPTSLYMGLDPQTAFKDLDKKRLNGGLLEREFTNVRDECLGLKVYLAETTGGNNIALEHAAKVTEFWHQTNPDKPVIFHVEGDDVSTLFQDIYKLQNGKDIPVHIAHVSSRQELTAVIAAKEAGMNVTCEVTPHHLFLDETVRDEIGGYGCMKPSLKPQEDIAFLWANMKYIDIFASDCAPHRISDKERESPAYGVTNHTVMLPLLIGAVERDLLSMEDIYQKFCVAPRKRFNLPLDDGSYTEVLTDYSLLENTVEDYDGLAAYGQSPFTRLNRQFRLIGLVTNAVAGLSVNNNCFLDARTSYSHLIRPKNIR